MGNLWLTNEQLAFSAVNHFHNRFEVSFKLFFEPDRILPELTVLEHSTL
jgi:hypothetical protein